jgi:hypothetical protein
VNYLLDINALIALGHSRHVHHALANAWFASVKGSAGAMHTCALTELGFVRVSVQAGLQPNVAAARVALAKLKASSPVEFSLLADGLGMDRLPAYVRKPVELADGHLLELAREHGVKLVTLDTTIPGALVLG